MPTFLRVGAILVNLDEIACVWFGEGKAEIGLTNGKHPEFTGADAAALRAFFGPGQRDADGLLARATVVNLTPEFAAKPDPAGSVVVEDGTCWIGKHASQETIQAALDKAADTGLPIKFREFT